MIRIGNQTACWAATPRAPFDYAVASGFDAFEWFPDKKPNGGWDDTDLDGAQRHQLRETARNRSLRLSVHARWQANPLQPESQALFEQDLALARDLGAVLFNIHLYHEQGIAAYVQAIRPLMRQTAEAGLELAIENTPHHSPEDFNELFAQLRRLEAPAAGHVGMCFDLGHANLCAATRNDYLQYVDRLAAHVPIIHLHLHENSGDADTHLPLFTGPAGRDDSGIRGLLARLRRRQFTGSIILEQWPHPPSLLNQARDRLLKLLASIPGGTGDPPVPSGDPPDGTETTPRNASPVAQVSKPAVSPISKSAACGQPEAPTGLETCDTADLEVGGTARNDASSRCSSRREEAPSNPAESSQSLLTSAATVLEDFAWKLVAGDHRSRSWREKLDFVRELLASETNLTAEQLVDLAVYLRFLGTGEIPCVEDGRHFRPVHHARIALQIQERLAALRTPENAFIIRKLYPWLPSTARDFQRAEPLTRIRDIAHRNDIPADLKQEIKHSLQNKLHRCAGPEDLATSTALLERITASGADYAPAFVEQFRIFHEELKEFFNARSLADRLQALVPAVNGLNARLIHQFLEEKTQTTPGAQIAVFHSLTELRRGLLAEAGLVPDLEKPEFLLADIGLEDFAFVLLSGIVNDFGEAGTGATWETMLELLQLTLANLELSQVELEECRVLHAELRAWQPLDPADREQLLRLKATVLRARRLAESYCDRIMAWFPPRALALGRALAVPETAARIFGEAEIRGHLVFQLSKLASSLLRRLREALHQPAWDVVVSGEATGRVVSVERLSPNSGVATTTPLGGTGHRPVPSGDPPLGTGSAPEYSRTADSPAKLPSVPLGQWPHGTGRLPVPPEPVLVLLKQAEGDEDIPAGITGLVLPHDLPHLSHLGVRARQAGVVLVVCEEAAQLEELQRLEGKIISLSASAEKVVWHPATAASAKFVLPREVRVPQVRLLPEPLCIPLEQALANRGGNKADGVRRLAELGGTGNLPVPLGHRPDGTEGSLATETAVQKSPGAGHNPLSEMELGGTGNLPVPLGHRPHGMEGSLATETAVQKSPGAGHNPLSEMELGGTGNLPVPLGHRPHGMEGSLALETAVGKSPGALPVPTGEPPLGLFKTPPALVIPFGALAEVLRAAPGTEAEYRRLLNAINTSAEGLAAARQLRELIQQLPFPEAMVAGVAAKFSRHTRLMVRSSANDEDLANLAGAGLYESVANVSPVEVAPAVRAVWASLWTRRAVLSRQQAGVPQTQAHMAVLLQQMIVPDYSFILHTVNPITRRRHEAYVELVVGLGETLASAATRGNPYRLVCDGNSGVVTTLAFASFSEALWPDPAGGLRRHRVDYSRVPLSLEPAARAQLGRRLAAIAQFVESAFHAPQDIEGVVKGDDIYLVQSRPQQGMERES